MRLLLVEDEQVLRESLSTALKDAGFVVDAVGDGEEGLYYGKEYPIDVAIVDLGLPAMSGMELISALRKAERNFPILILTARDRWQDKVNGLESGADDYVVKPFHTEEVLARINALLRRQGGWADSVLRAGPISLDTRAQQVSVEDSNVDLTSYEYKVLEHLMMSAGKVVSKTELTESLYEQDFERDSNVIEVFVGRLRRKLDPANTIKPIETLRGRGYRFTLE
ncbi:MAG: response regulator transcription factor [Gammaproteobacteria bacterium]|nr:response regulator transcription factor [Gammaproteobacteria bacterium]MDH3768105.1 response regulator transcription factor [Gammaproteobacteria bacterium]